MSPRVTDTQGLRCPHCGHSGSSVVDSRQTDENHARRRRHACDKCRKRFTTYEVYNSKYDLIYETERLLGNLTTAVAEFHKFLRQTRKATTK